MNVLYIHNILYIPMYNTTYAMVHSLRLQQNYKNCCQFIGT